MAATIDEARKNNIRTAAHLAQMGVAWMNTLDAARLGLSTQEHWYGLPESLFTDRTVQDFPLDYNYNNEQHRFGQAGRLWQQAAMAWVRPQESGHEGTDRAGHHAGADDDYL